VAEADAESLGDRHDDRLYRWTHRTTSGSSIAGARFEAKETYGNTNPPGADCCVTAPSVLEFDKARQPPRTLVAVPARVTTGLTRTTELRSITKATFWIGGNGRTVDPKLQDTGASNVPEASQPGAYADNQILKFTQDGKFLMQIGHPFKSKGSNDTENLKGPAKMFIDPKTNELYVADGYGTGASSCLTLTLGSTSGIGAPMVISRMTLIPALQSGCANRPAVPQSGALRPTRGRRTTLRLRPGERSHPGIQAGRHLRQGANH